MVRAPGNDFDELLDVYHLSAWGKGYATEAGRAMLDYVFRHSTLDCLYATIHPDNAASIHVAHKLGFRYDRQAIDTDGTPTHFYVIERNFRIDKI